MGNFPAPVPEPPAPEPVVVPEPPAPEPVVVPEPEVVDDVEEDVPVARSAALIEEALNASNVV